MAVTKGEMTSLPTSQTIFLQTVEEPEDNRINFRDSLKFFQEQLVINGANFPAPSTGFRSGNNTLRKNGHRPYKEQNSDSNAKITKESNAFENDIQSIRNCKIAIPTVDTILESVRVLRAIQKSQEERGSSWNLDVAPNSDLDFNCKDDWVQGTDAKESEFTDRECKDIRNDNSSPNFSNKESIADINENRYSDKESDNKENNAAPSTNTVDKQPVTDAHQNGYSDKDENNEELSVKTVDKQTTVNINQNGYSDKETSNENHETYSNPCGDKQTNTDTNQNVYSSKEHNNNINSETLPTSSEEHILSSENLNGITHKESNSERIDGTSSITTVKKQTIKDTNRNEYFDRESNNKSSNEASPTDSGEKQITDAIREIQVTDTEINLTQSSNDSKSNMLISNPVNEICSFWPVNTLQKVSHWNEENSASGTKAGRDRNIVVTEVLDELKFKINVDEINSFPIHENGLDVKSSDKEDFTEKQIQQIDAYNNNILINTLEQSILFQNLHEGITKSDQINDTPDSLRAVCTDFLNNLNEKTPTSTEISKEMLIKVTETTTEILKIETYEDIVAQKPDHFLLNESLWKETCSPSDSTSAKLEHNDSDSGIGTQRSASSLSPNNPNQMQKDSWSDTCSSHYASAECSPYHSLNNVFESSMGLNSTLGEAKEIEHSDILTQLKENEWEDAVEKSQESVKESPEKDPTLVPQENIGKSPDDYASVPQENVIESPQNNNSVPQVTDCDKEKEQISDRYVTDSHIRSNDFESFPENAELDTEISYCNFITNYTIEKPCERIEDNFEEAQPASGPCDNAVTEPKVVNGQEISAKEQITESVEAIREKTFDVERAESSISLESLKEYSTDDDSCDLPRIQKFSAASCDLISIVETLYVIKENQAYQMLPTGDEPEEKFEETLFVLSKGAFCAHPEDNYLVIIEDSVLRIAKDSQILLSLNMKYGEVSTDTNVLRIDNRMGRCVYVRCEFADVLSLQARIKLHCLKHWQTDCLQLVHYPLKCHQNVVIIDIGSCSTRAGILMDQPTLPSLFFPTICATDKRTGTCVYGMEALQPEVRQHSNLSFPVRPTIKITKHTIDIDLLEGLFKKIFHDLNVDPTQYTVQVCLPRNLSINAQTALVRLLLEVLNAKAVSLTNQALLTLYAHDVSTAVVVDIGDRTDVLPVVDGFIVENGVTKLPHGGQRLIHHMKHGLAEKRISLSNDIDSFIVQYIIENLAYVAVDYEKEVQVSSQYPDIVTKTVMLQPASSSSAHCKSITLEEARFKIPEGLFNPEMWGLDSPGIHHLVQKAIQATSVDARKRIAENIYVSGGVTMLPGFVERLHKEVTKLSKAKIVPKVYASNYRYHCTYIGACKFAKMEVFPQVCITLKEYTQNNVSALKKCSLYF